VTISPDIRGFYSALGIELPGFAAANVAVRCFADPDSHAHGDRTPSCSVSTEHGAWRCWGCGAHGGAYDAALLRGHTPRSAMELKIEFGLSESPGRSEHLAPRHRSVPRRRPADESRALTADENDVERWHAELFSPARRHWLERLAAQRLWSITTMRVLGLGYDRGRLAIPIRNEPGALRGALRYRPAAEPKMLAVLGTRLGLIPHPASEPSPRLLLVEGPADMIAARSRGWPAIAVPGDHAWRPQWAALLQERQVTIAMDSDDAGRAAAERIAHDLHGVCASRVLDLAPDRTDGFDLTDWLRTREQRPRSSRCTTFSSSRPTISR
jgi:DNA primase